MKKKQTTKRILAGILGAIFCFTLLPLANIKTLYSAKASEPTTEYKGADYSPSNGEFSKTESTQNTKLTDWSIIIKADQESNSGYTTAGGAIDTNIANFENAYKNSYIGDSLIAELEKSLGTLTEDQKNKIKQELSKNLIAPLNSNYTLSNSTSTSLALLLNAGKIVSLTETDVNFTDRKVYYYAKSDSKVTLSSYSFYKLTVDVYVEGDDTNASIKISGDIEETLFSNIAQASTTNKIYRYKVSNSADSTITYFNSTDDGTSDVMDKITIAESPRTYTKTTEGDTTTYIYTDGTTSYYATQEAVGDSGKWVTYTAYISTGYKSDSHNIYVELGLGQNEDNKSSGKVYFDNVTIKQIQYADFVENATKDSTTTCIDNRGILKDSFPNEINKYTNYKVITDFNNTSKTAEEYNWTISSSSDAPDYETQITSVIKEDSKTIYNTFNNNNGVLYVNNTTDSEITLKTNKFALDQFRYYRISFFVRSDYNAIEQNEVKISANIFATINSGDAQTERSLSNAYVVTPYDTSVTNTNSQSQYNYWKQVVLYVQSCPIYSTEAYLSISIGASGKVYLDQLTTEYTTATEYDSASSDRKLSLNSTLKSDNITNGHFYYSSTTTLDYTTPLAVKSWTKTQSDVTADIYAYYENNSNEHYTTLLKPEEVVIAGTTISYNGDTYNQSSEEGKENEFLTADKKIVVIKDVVFSYNADMKNYVSEKYNNFTLFADTPKAYYGIINSNTNDYQTLLNIDAMETINSASKLENYLAISNQEPYNLGISYTSSKFTLSKNTYQRIIVEAYTNNLNGDAKIELLNSDKKVVGEIELQQNTGWQKYEIYVHTSDSSDATSYYLQLSLGDKTDLSIGSTVLFKYCKYTTTAKDIFNTKQALPATERNNIAIVDLSTNNFTELGEKIGDNIYKALLHTNSITENAGNVLILDTTQADKDNPVNNYGDRIIKAYGEDGNPYILVIDNASGQTSEVSTIINNTLSSDKYYKIKVILMAKDLAENTTATIEFGGEVATLDLKNTEDYTEYTIYVKTGKDTIKVSPIIKLNGEGKLFINSITTETSSSTELSTAKKDAKTNPDTIKISDFTQTATEENEEENIDTEEESHTVEILCATLSSILLVGAIIFALVFTKIKSRKKSNTKVESNKVSIKDETKGFV